MANGRRWRRWLVPGLVVLLLAAIGALGLGARGASRGRLELLALDADSRFSADAHLDPGDPTADGPARFPLIFAIRNNGERAAAPDSLFLSVPGWVRLLGADGRPRPAQDDGETLVRYRLGLLGEPFEPGALPLVPGGVERLWIAAELPSITCAPRWDGVIEFVPTPEYDPALLATIHAFYSLESRTDRSTGILTIRLDPELVAPVRTGGYEAGATTVKRPAVTLPRVTTMVLEGIRETTCGAPELRMAFRSVVWRTGETGAGRFIALLQDGAPRRLLYDRNGDARIEFEAWDGDGDGQFEAGRTTSFAIPQFLLPITPVSATADSIAADSAQAVAPDTPPLPADTMHRDTVRRDTTLADSMKGRAPVRRDTLESTR